MDSRQQWTVDLGRAVPAAGDDEVLRGVELDAVDAALVAGVAEPAPAPLHAPDAGRAVGRGCAEQGGPRPTAGHGHVPDSVPVALELTDEGGVEVVGLEAGHDLAGLGLQLVSRVGEVLLGEGLDHVHVEDIRVLFGLLPGKIDSKI